jgi:hypothetical protein
MRPLSPLSSLPRLFPLLAFAALALLFLGKTLPPPLAQLAHALGLSLVVPPLLLGLFLPFLDKKTPPKRG